MQLNIPKLTHRKSAAGSTELLVGDEVVWTAYEDFSGFTDGEIGIDAAKAVHEALLRQITNILGVNGESQDK
tara:strand:+ start:2291 stop:2506 length:216 start_codon:yes stop_codon:yes gene_type:complete